MMTNSGRSDARRIALLVAILLAVGMLSSFTGILVLYRVGLRQQLQRMEERADREARLIEEMLRRERDSTRSVPRASLAPDPLPAVVEVLRGRKARAAEFSRTGEVILAQRHRDSIYFLLTARRGQAFSRLPLPMDTNIALPMRRALSGSSGSVVGPDYRGVTVVAGYESIKSESLGVVAQIDLAEIQEPFFQASRVSALIAMLGVLFGTLVFLRVTQPMLKHVAESERLFRAIFEQAGVGVARLDRRTGRFLQVNRRFTELTGYPYEELVTKHYSEIIHPEERADAIVFLDEGLASRHQELTAERRLVRKDGETIWCSVTSALMSGVGRGLTDIIEVAVDITERKKAEDALRESEASFRAMFESNALAMAIIGDNEYVLMVNRRYCKLVQMDEREIIGTHWTALIHPDDVEGMRDYSRRLRRSRGTTRQREFRFFRKDGALRYGLMSAAVLPDQSKVICSIADITERRQALDRERLARDVLETLNRPESGIDEIREILKLIRTGTSIEAVGIRLRVGDDFPYYELNGFNQHFARYDHGLLARDTAGAVRRDESGKPILECLCGVVISGRTNPAQPCFTPNGSFWTNDMTTLLATTTEQERMTHTRNFCHASGYESVALIPLRSGGETFGLLQLSDCRRNQFTVEMIHFFEDLATSIGIALARRMAMNALSESEELYRATFEQASAGIARIAPDGRILDVNSRWCEITGERQEELLHHTPSGSPTASLAAFAIGARAFAEGSAQNILHAAERNFIRPDGNPVWVNLSAAVIRTPAGAPNFYIVVIEDTTVAREAQATIRRMATFPELAPNPIVELDTDGNVSYVNPRAQELFPDIQHAGLNHPWLAGLEKVIADVKAGTVAHQTREVELSGAYYLQHIVFVAGVGRIRIHSFDYTSQRRAEKELQEAHAALAHVSRVSTMGELTAALAHELNQPLGAILTNAEAAIKMLSGDAPKLEELRAILSDIAADDARAGSVVHRIRDHLRKADAEKRPLDVNKLVQDTITLIRNDQLLIGATIDLELADGLTAVSAHRIQLQQVLLNLLVNSLDAVSKMAPGARRITVQTSLLNGAEPNKTRVCVATQDTGPGFDEKQLAQLFEPFYSTKPGGLGIGLTICQTIIKSLDGSIRAERPPEGGARMVIELPPAQVQTRQKQ